MSDQEPSSGAGVSYRDAGVDIEEGHEAVRQLRGFVESTRTKRVVGGVGAFAGLFAYPNADSERLLVSSMDGVGTKLKINAHLGRWQDAGYDIVSHCVSDILVQGARPLFFLDYIASAKLSAGIVASLVEGMSEACRESGCALLGGETAEMPGVYRTGEVDVAGTIVGDVERSKLLDGSAVQVGDRLIGLPAQGLHTNGYSLARRILGFDENRSIVEERPDADGPSWGDLLTRRHQMYFPRVEPLLDSGKIHAMAHITGGGLTHNVPRVLPPGASAVIDREAWTTPPVFRYLVNRGSVPVDEAYRVFNMGIGLVLVISPSDVAGLLARLEDTGERAIEMGEVVAGDGAVQYRD